MGRVILHNITLALRDNWKEEFIDMSEPQDDDQEVQERVRSEDQDGWQRWEHMKHVVLAHKGY